MTTHTAADVQAAWDKMRTRLLKNLDSARQQGKLNSTLDIRLVAWRTAEELAEETHTQVGPIYDIFRDVINDAMGAKR